LLQCSKVKIGNKDHKITRKSDKKKTHIKSTEATPYINSWKLGMHWVEKLNTKTHYIT